MSSPHITKIFGFFAIALLLSALRDCLDVLGDFDLDVFRDVDIALSDLDFLLAFFAIAPPQLNGPTWKIMLMPAAMPIASNTAAVINVSDTGNSLWPCTMPSATIASR